MVRFEAAVRDSVVSTNVLVKQAIEEGMPEGTCFRAFEQTGGYGRQGRTWASPFGGMYESVLLRPAVARADLPTLALVAALSVRATAHQTAPDGAFLVKWPNDVVCPAGKVAGISCEVHAGAVCLGIGINVFEPATAPVVSGKNMPAYLAHLRSGDEAPRAQEHGITADQRFLLNQVGDTLLFQLAERYDVWAEEGFAPFLSEYRAHMAWRGRAITVQNQLGRTLEHGVVRDIDATGALVLETDGGVRTVTSGEVHIVA